MKLPEFFVSLGIHGGYTLHFETPVPALLQMELIDSIQPFNTCSTLDEAVRGIRKHIEQVLRDLFLDGELWFDRTRGTWRYRL